MHNHCDLEKKTAEESGKNLYANGISLISKFNVYYNQYRYEKYTLVSKEKRLLIYLLVF